MADRRKQTWSEIGHTERRVLVGLGTVQVGLQGAALWDLRHRPARDVRGPRPLWAALSFVNFVGPITYFAVGRRRPAH